MGRKPLVYRGPSYPEWLANGCPPLTFTVSQLALWVEPTISRQMMNRLVVQEVLIREDGLIKTSHPRNLDVLKSWTSRTAPVPGVHVDEPTPTPGAIAPTDFTPGAIRDPVAAQIPQLDIEAILAAINEGHLRALNGSDAQKVQRLESALKTRVEREAKRGVLIDRRLVQVVFGKLWQIDSNQWKTISAKLAADIAGEFGIEDVAVLLRVEQKIDKEVNRILAHVKRLLDNFLIGVGGQAV